MTNRCEDASGTWRAVLFVGLLALAGCGGGSGNGRSVGAPASYTVGGTVSGLTGAGLALQLNGSGSLSVAADGPFTFPALADGSAYAVTVSAQPTGPAQTCTVTGGAGTLAGANVTSVAVTCAAHPAGPFSVGGAVSGLTGGGLVLRNNGGDDLTIGASGPFTFAAALADGSAYAVTVRTQPAGQKCTVSNGAGTLAGAAIAAVEVACAARSSAPIAYVYTANYAYGAEHSISRLAMDETGGLNVLSPEKVDVGGGPGLALDRTGKHLYAVADTAGVRHYTVGSDGSLTLAETTMPPEAWAAAIVAHPSRAAVYVSSWRDGFGTLGRVDAYDIGPDGALTLASGSPYAPGAAQGGYIRAVVTPSGTHAYTLESASDPANHTQTTRITHYAIGSDGAWTVDPVLTYETANAPLPAIDPAGTFLYFGTFLHDILRIGPSGGLAPAGTFDFGTGDTAELTIHPSGKYAYAARYNDGRIVQFTVGVDGSLAQNGTVNTLGLHLGAVRFDPAGKYAYVSQVPIGRGQRALAQFTVDEHGQLIPMAEPYVMVGGSCYAQSDIVFAPVP